MRIIDVKSDHGSVFVNLDHVVTFGESVGRRTRFVVTTGDRYEIDKPVAWFIEQMDADGDVAQAPAAPGAGEVWIQYWEKSAAERAEQPPTFPPG